MTKSWDKYFLDMATTIATRSKDPSTKVGTVLVSDRFRIIGTGYNGFPPGFPDTQENWSKENKYPLVIHAEMNCILDSSGEGRREATLYTTLQPCGECIKLIAAAGIKKVVFGCYLPSHWPDTRKLAETFSVELIKG